MALTQYIPKTNTFVTLKYLKTTLNSNAMFKFVFPPTSYFNMFNFQLETTTKM